MAWDDSVITAGTTVTLLVLTTDIERNIFTGGYDGNYLSSVEVYRLGDATSTTLPVRLRVARYGHACTIYRNKMVVTGGYGDRLSSVEIATRGQDGWGQFRIIDNALPEGRISHTATTVSLGTIYLTG